MVRRRVALTDLDRGRGNALSGVIEQLAERRLLTVSDGDVEVAHEALLREWPRLRAWLAEDAEGRRLHRRLRDAARAWEGDARDPGGLYRGARLAAALDWAAANDAELSPAERAFLADSRSASERAQRRLRIVLGGVAALLVLAVIAGLVALDQRGDARDEATTGAAQRLGAQALADTSLDRGMLLARQGVALEDSVQTRSNLFATLLKSPAVVGVIGGDGDPLLSLDLTADGRTLSFIDDDGTLSRVDADTRRLKAPRRTVPAASEPTGFHVADFTDDGSRLAVSGGQPYLIDAATRIRLAPIQLASSRQATSVQFSADRRSVIATIENSAINSTVLQRFDARDARALGAPEVVVRSSRLVSVLIVPGGAHVVTTFEGGPTVVRDARSLRAERPAVARVEALEDGRADRRVVDGGDHRAAVRREVHARGLPRRRHLDRRGEDPCRRIDDVRLPAGDRQPRPVIGEVRHGPVGGRPLSWDRPARRLQAAGVGVHPAQRPVVV